MSLESIWRETELNIFSAFQRARPMAAAKVMFKKAPAEFFETKTENEEPYVSPSRFGLDLKNAPTSP
jgi:hypothetical protein